MRKIIWLVMMVILVCGVAGFAAGEGAETPESPGETPLYCRFLYCTPYWGMETMDVPVQVITNDPGWVLPGESGLLDGVRYFPYDSSAGLYAVGEGEPAGEKASVALRSESENVYIVRLGVPGKYAVGDSFFYVLDPGEESLRALDAELRAAVNASYGETETDTAKKLHHWLCDRVRSVIPADREDLLSACSDPVNALLTGYACREAYAPLYQMLLQRAGIHSVVLRGTAGETDGSWNMSFLDGAWLWTDAAMDDPKDQKQSRYLSREAADLAKTHTPGAADRAFVAEMTGSPVIDRLLNGSMPFALKEEDVSSPHAFELFWYDGPACVIGDSATVTYHRISNHFTQNGFKTPEEFLAANIYYMLWTDEGQFYFDTQWTSPSAYPDVPPVPKKEKMFTVDYAAEDLSTFTVTYRYPAKYSIFGLCPFYFVSPSQANLAELVGVIDKAVEKSLSTDEKKAAAKLHEWVSSRLSYSYGDDSDRSMNSTFEGMGALSFRKCVCSGYAEAWHILMKQSGIFDFIVTGFVNDQMGHAWNINRLDGVWSHTDVTWSDTTGRNYFAVAPEKIYRDHEPGQRWFLDSIVFGDPLNLLFQQFESGYLPATYLPDVLSSLPTSVDGYGFPGKQPEFILVKEFSMDSPDVEMKLSRRAAVSRVALLDDSGAEVNTQVYEGSPDSSKIAAPIPCDSRFRLELGSFDWNKPLKREGVYETLICQAGTEQRAEYQYRVPLKKGEIHGFSADSWRAFVYDRNLQPSAVRWHLSDSRGTTDLEVSFTPDGLVDSYTVQCSPVEGQKTGWTVSADGTLLEYIRGRRTVSDLETVKDSEWQRIRFY